MAEQHFDFHYVKTPTGSISGQSVLKQTEDAINDVGEFSYQASVNAAEAVQKANQAVDTANTANNTASSALTQVNAAVEKVNTLEVQVGEIAEQVEEANSKSDQAVSTANSALSTAQEALSTANTALSNSEQAVTTANGANTTANNANSTAQDALEIAEEAKTTAESAVVDTDSAVEEMTTLLNQATQQATNATQQAQNAAASAASAASAAQSAVDDATEMLNAVVAYIPQNLTEDQQAQARENIAGVGFEDYATASTGGVVKVTGTDGITINSSGVIAVDFDAMPPEQMEQVVLSMVQEGGGISVDSDGQLYVDFASMPTDKFEAMLKSIRVPIWLTRTTQFFVNDATGSDELDEGRGLTSGKPFKTIQKCVNFIADNYNLSTFNVLINIADGTYNESVTLPSYTSSTGNIVLRASNPYMVTISAVDESCLSAYKEATYYVQYINFKLTINAQTEGTRHGISMIYVDSATIKFTGFNCETTYNGDFRNGLVYNATFSAINYGNIEFYPGTKPYSAAYNNSANPCQVYANWLQRFSQVIFHATYDASVAVNLLFSVSGVLGSSTAYGIFMRCSGSSKFINQVYSYTTSFSGTLSNCRRYLIESGSSCETNGQGADFFPGDQNGSIDSATYAWYN